MKPYKSIRYSKTIFCLRKQTSAPLFSLSSSWEIITVRTRSFLDPHYSSILFLHCASPTSKTTHPSLSPAIPNSFSCITNANVSLQVYEIVLYMIWLSVYSFHTQIVFIWEAASKIGQSGRWRQLAKEESNAMWHQLQSVSERNMCLVRLSGLLST